MRDKTYGFIIKATVQGEFGLLNVIGRCGDIPIRVDDAFNVIYHRQRCKPHDSLGLVPARSEQKPVSLRVVCIHAYDHSLPELGQGMTGALSLDGVGGDEVVPGWVLSRDGA